MRADANVPRRGPRTALETKADIVGSPPYSKKKRKKRGEEETSLERRVLDHCDNRSSPITHQVARERKKKRGTVQLQQHQGVNKASDASYSRNSRMRMRERRGRNA